MSNIYPDKFSTYCKTPNLKGAFVTIVQPSRPSDCKNCGGIGTMIIFLATEGPYDFVPNGVIERAKGDIPAKYVIAKWVNGKWWGGRSVEEACPVCHGLGIEPGYVEPPISMRQGIITNPLKIVKSEVEVDDYTDI